jgi:tight adherence protein C
MVYLIAGCAGILVYAVIYLANAQRAQDLDTVQARLRQLDRQRRGGSLALREELSAPLSERVLKPLLRSAVRFFVRLIPARDRGGNNGKLKRSLEMAGFSMGVEDFLALQLVVMLGAGGAGVLLGAVAGAIPSRILLLFLVGTFGGYTVLRYLVAAKATARRTAIEQQLPDMLDLLSVSVEAGLGFEQALHYITENMEGPLIDEVAVTYREMSMGRPRRDALALLGERCDVPDVQSFTGALNQAGQLGIPIRNVLQAQSAAIRRSRRSKVQEKAAKVSTKILFPMLFFIFPVLFIVLMGPAVLSIMENFK